MHTEIKINRPLATHILTLAQKSPEHEICGLISADSNGKPTTVYPIQNISDSPSENFEMDEKQRVHALEAIHKKNETLFAIYHSHPNSAATPSEKDLMAIGCPDAYQLIVSLSTKGVLEMRAYQVQGTGIQEIQLSV